MERVDGLGMEHYCDRLRVNVQQGREEWKTSIMHTYTAGTVLLSVLPRAEIKSGDSENYNCSDYCLFAYLAAIIPVMLFFDSTV